MANIIILDDEQNAGIGLQGILTKGNHSAYIIQKLHSVDALVGLTPVDLWIVEPHMAKGPKEREILREVMESIASHSHVVLCTTIYPDRLSGVYGLRQGTHYHEYFRKPIDPEDLLSQMQFKLD